MTTDPSPEMVRLIRILRVVAIIAAVLIVIFIGREIVSPDPIGGDSAPHQLATPGVH